MTYLKFLGISILTNIKISLSRRLAFIISLITVTLIQTAFIASWKSFFNTYESVAGWEFKDMLLSYGSTAMSIGLAEMLFFGLRDLSKIVETGQLDVFLIQPKHIIIKVALSKSHFPALGEILVGLGFVVYSGYLFVHPFQFLIIFFLGTIFVFSIYIYLGCLSFFTDGASELVKDLRTAVLITAGQPNSAYSGILRFVTLSFLPVAYWSFFPVEYIRTGNIKFLFFSCTGTFLFLFISIWIFNQGLKRYESGSGIVLRY